MHPVRVGQALAANASDQGARTERTSGQCSTTGSQPQLACVQVGQTDGGSGAMRRACVIAPSLQLAGCLAVKAS